MLVWNKPQLGDREWISKCVEEAGYMGSDAAFANIYLLQSKYNIRVAFYKDCLIRYYEGHNSRHGYTFPLGAGNIDKALEAIKQDAIDNNRKLEFCFITEEQKAVLEEMLEGELVYSRDDGDSDYIYGQPELSTLAGRAYHKKKNHVSKFKRTYEELRYSEIGAGNTEDALMVEDMWYNEHKNDAEMLEVGNGGMNKEEYKTHFSMWCMLATPLMAGNDLRKMDADTKEILTNKEVIAVNQDKLGEQARRFMDMGEKEIWAKPLANGELAICFLNRTESVWKLDYDWHKQTIYFADEVNIHKKEYKIRDLWKHQDIGTTKSHTQYEIAPHGVLMVRLSQK